MAAETEPKFADDVVALDETTTPPTTPPGPGTGGGTVPTGGPYHPDTNPGDTN